MGLKIAKVVYDATKSLMSNPVSKAVGIGAVFGAGVLLGNYIGLDSFERSNQTEVVDSTSTLQKQDKVENNNTVLTTEQVEQNQNTDVEISNKIKELKKEIEVLDNLPVQNLKEKIKFYSESWGDAEYMNAGKYTVQEGTVNYKGKTMLVEINESGDKKFYDSNGNLVYSFLGDSFNKYVSFESRNYDENNHLIESLGKNWMGKYYWNKNEILNQETKDKENLLHLNKYTQVQYSDDKKDGGYVTITDENGHFVKGVSFGGGYNKINIKNDRIIDINGFKMEYDKKGRLIKNKSNNESYTYDNNGNIKEVLQDNEAIKIKYTFEYNEQNELVDVKEETIEK